MYLYIYGTRVFLQFQSSSVDCSPRWEQRRRGELTPISKFRTSFLNGALSAFTLPGGLGCSHLCLNVPTKRMMFELSNCLIKFFGSGQPFSTYDAKSTLVFLCILLFILFLQHFVFCSIFEESTTIIYYVL